MTSVVRAHPRLVALGAFLTAVALAIPVVAYVVVPIFVRSTLVEAPPVPSATASAAPNATVGAGSTSAPAAPVERTLARGDLVRITPVDYGTGVVRIVGFDGASGTGAFGRFLRFENVEIAAAPDMYVYLSDRSDGKPGTFVDLGKLKATSGSFNYEIPSAVDLSAVRSVVVWCRQFSVTVTYATLASP